MILTRSTFLLLLIVSCASFCASCLAGEREVDLSDEQFKKLDQFEGFALQKADKAFETDKRQAAAEYEAFILDNPRSKVLPYALLRKARCIQLSNKRNAAIKEYQEVIDYFPDNAQFAAAALYYIGQCYWDDGNPEMALKFWARMADHAEFSKHFLAATALTRLADAMMEQGKAEKAVEYFSMSAVNFRRSNPDAARHAMRDKVIPYYIRTNPNEAKLRDFYVKVQTFDNDPQKFDPDATKDTRYWSQVREFIERFGHFNETQADLAAKYYAYWAQQLQGKFPDWDDYQLDAALYQLRADGDAAKFAQRVDEQFSKYQKDGEFDRVNKFIRAYARQKNKVQEYYSKLDFARMTNGQIRALLTILYDDVKDAALAKNVFGQLKFAQMPDNEKVDLIRYLWHRDETSLRRACKETPQPLGQMELLRYLHWRKNVEEGLQLCEQLKGAAEFAKEALWMRAELLQHSQQYDKAIGAYREADNPPESQFRVAECLQRLGKVDPAIAQLNEIQNFFQKEAPEAALRIAWVYRDAGQKPKFEVALRNVLKKYPKSGQSSTAHQELEKMGAKIGGGVDAD